MTRLKSRLSWRWLIAILLPAIAPDAFATDDPPDGSGSTNAFKAGHSLHGEAFNEGPRQSARLMPGVGKVKLKITSKHPEAQAFFNQGIGQLHGFWYFEAERSFRQVAALDAECAMAYWGMAMANINTPKRAADFIKLAEAKKAKATRREQVWIDAYARFYADSKQDENARRGALTPTWPRRASCRNRFTTTRTTTTGWSRTSRTSAGCAMRSTSRKT